MGLLARLRKADPNSGDIERPVAIDDQRRLCVSHGLDGDKYRLFVPPAAAGANQVAFDLFNPAASKNDIEVLAVVPIVSGDVAVTGVVALSEFLTRTTDIGTGGTAATYEGTSFTAATISKLDPASPTATALIVSARALPTGGATIGALLGFNSMYTEETNAASYNRNNLIDPSFDGTGKRVIVKPGTGIQVKQGTVASVGNIGFIVDFSVVRQ
jgi:hypothetical protein